MRVDTQRMDEAIDQLLQLERQLAVVESKIQSALYVLLDQELGGAKQPIVRSLNDQIDAMERRELGTRQLAMVLRSARDQYQHGEKKAQDEAFLPYRAVVERVTSDIIDKIRFISRGEEKDTIEKYIMPLIATGKRGSK